MKPKILIASPTYDGQAYSFDVFFKGIDNLEINADVLIVDNSEGFEYFDRLNEVKIGKKLTVIKDEYNSTDRIDKISHSRNKIRDYFLREGYDYLFFIDTDIVAPKDAIEKLLAADKEIISGVALCNINIDGENIVVPQIYKKNEENDDSVITFNHSELFPENVLEIGACGLDIVLLKRDVVEKIKFERVEDASEDIGFCIKAKEKGYKIYGHTGVLCRHYMEEGSLFVDPKYGFILSKPKSK